MSNDTAVNLLLVIMMFEATCAGMVSLCFGKSITRTTIIVVIFSAMFYANHDVAVIEKWTSGDVQAWTLGLLLLSFVVCFGSIALELELVSRQIKRKLAEE